MDKDVVVEIWGYHCEAVKTIAQIYESVATANPRPSRKEKVWSRIYERAVDEQRIFMHNHRKDIP